MAPPPATAIEPFRPAATATAVALTFALMSPTRSTVTDTSPATVAAVPATAPTKRASVSLRTLLRDIAKPAEIPLPPWAPTPTAIEAALTLDWIDAASVAPTVTSPPMTSPRCPSNARVWLLTRLRVSTAPTETVSEGPSGVSPITTLEFRMRASISVVDTASTVTSP